MKKNKKQSPKSKPTRDKLLENMAYAMVKLERRLKTLEWIAAEMIAAKK